MHKAILPSSPGLPPAHPPPGLTRVLPRQLSDLFGLEDEARRPEHLSQHGRGGQEQRGPHPSSAHGPLHPGGRREWEKQSEPGPPV